MAALAPMPRPRVTIAVMVNAGDLNNKRTPCRTSRASASSIGKTRWSRSWSFARSRTPSAIAARLFDPPRDAVPVQRSERLERFQNHQRERSAPHLGRIHHPAPMGMLYERSTGAVRCRSAAEQVAPEAGELQDVGGVHRLVG